MKQRNIKTGKFRSFSLGFRMKLAFMIWYEKKKYLIAAFVWGVLVGTLLGFALFYPTDASLEALEPTITQEVIEVKDKYELRGYAFCYNPIICIRDIGEELGVDNRDIIIAINIAKAESGLRPDAIGKNTNGTYDLGVMQINDVHSKRISRQDRLDYEKNIRFAFQLRKEQGNWNAWSVCRSKVNCQ